MAAAGAVHSVVCRYAIAELVHAAKKWRAKAHETMGANSVGGYVN
jgi:hypothetical protein